MGLLHMPRTLLNQKNLKLKKTFIRQLRQMYHVEHRSIWQCFLAYMGFMKKYGVDYLTVYTDWQLMDYRVALTNYKSMWHRSRRGGKSLGLSVLAVFLSILNFGHGANKGCVVWRAPYTDQLIQAQKWFKMNPFVTHISNSDNNVSVLDSNYVDMSCLSSGKVASRGVSVLIMDEYKKVYKGHKMFLDAIEAYGMLAEGTTDEKKMISASTGQRLTMFHDQFLSGEYAYCVHPWSECTWINEDFIESERRSNMDDPWYVPQEYECVWVARGGTAFRNLYIVDRATGMVTHNEERFALGDHPFFPKNWKFPEARKGGVDWNESSGHYLVVGSVDDEAIYINREHVLTTIAELKPFDRDLRIAVESGPFAMNRDCTLEAERLGIKVIRENWSGKIIPDRLRKMRSKMIIIDRHDASFTLGNFQEAVFNDNNPKGENELKKTTKQHGLDAAMHMIHSSSDYGTFVPQMSSSELAYLKRRSRR